MNDAADDARHQRGAAAGAVGPRDRSERRVFDRRLDVVREPVPGERRDREREPARSAARSLHRGRDPGDDGRDGRRLGRVRPLRRRRRQRDHEVGRQSVLGLAARHAQQRQLARADAVCRRLEARQDAADLRVHARRTGDEGSSLVLHRRPRCRAVDERRTLAVTNAPYDFSNRLRRYEAKATYSPNDGHRVEGAYTRSTEAQTNATFNPTTSMDARSLYDADRVHGSRDGQLQRRRCRRISSSRPGSRRATRRSEHRRDLHRSDQRHAARRPVAQRARRYWAPTFCGVCDPEERDNTDVFVKGSYFLSRHGAGSHNLVFGYDGFNDRRFANNHQSGSDYRILGTSAIVDGELADAGVPRERHDDRFSGTRSS